jgi:hypothetical protein
MCDQNHFPRQPLSPKLSGERNEESEEEEEEGEEHIDDENTRNFIIICFSRSKSLKENFYTEGKR